MARERRGRRVSCLLFSIGVHTHAHIHIRTYLGRHGRREEERLALPRALLYEGFDLRGKTQVYQLVHLVHHLTLFGIVCGLFIRVYICDGARGVCWGVVVGPVQSGEGRGGQRRSMYLST